jgi:hypothetical protein
LHTELVLAARFEDGNVAIDLDLRAVGDRLCEKSRKRSRLVDLSA